MKKKTTPACPACPTQPYGAELMLSPFDFSTEALMDAVAEPGAFVDSIHFYLGVTIRPTILNIILDFIEPVLRVILGIILTPIILVVYLAQIILNLLIKAVETARLLVQEAQKALAKVEKAGYRVLQRAKRPYYNMKNAKYMLQNAKDIQTVMNKNKCKVRAAVQVEQHIGLTPRCPAAPRVCVEGARFQLL